MNFFELETCGTVTIVMDIYGVDFTSKPTRKKPITCLHCRLTGDTLQALSRYEFTNFVEFESGLQHSGPWIAGMDFPFGMSRKFIQNIGWPETWEGYVRFIASLERNEFRNILNKYKIQRPYGDKEHRRTTDDAAKAISPQKLHGVPVGLMFFEGAPRLLDAGVSIPHLFDGDLNRIVVEAYPGVLARSLIGRRSYKTDNKKKQSTGQHQARQEIFQKLSSEQFFQTFGFTVHASPTLCNDPSGDQLDSLLCAIQASWAWRNRETGFGAVEPVDALEGWIAHPFREMT